MTALTPPRILRGACQCAYITYTVSDSFAYAFYCHCSLCRRSTGAACKPIAGISFRSITLTSGSQFILKVKSSEWHEERCALCGSLLYSVVKDGSWAHIAMGTLVDDPSVKMNARCFVGSKAGWEVLPEDGLPRYEGHIPDEVMEAWMKMGEVDSEAKIESESSASK